MEGAEYQNSSGLQWGFTGWLLETAVLGITKRANLEQRDGHLGVLS